MLQKKTHGNKISWIKKEKNADILQDLNIEKTGQQTASILGNWNVWPFQTSRCFRKNSDWGHGSCKRKAVNCQTQPKQKGAQATTDTLGMEVNEEGSWQKTEDLSSDLVRIIFWKASVEILIMMVSWTLYWVLLLVGSQYKVDWVSMDW